MENKEETISYHIRDIRELFFFFRDVKMSHPELVKDASLFQISIFADFDLNEAENTISIVYDIIYNIPDGEKVIQALRYRIAFQFHVDNLISGFKKDNGFQIPDVFLAKFIDISINTTRGVLFSKVQGTFLNGVLLPLVNPMELLQFTKDQKELNGQNEVV